MIFNESLPLAVLGGLLFVVITFGIWLTLRKRKKKFPALIAGLTCLYGLTSSIYLFASYASYRSNILLWPLSIFSGVMAGIIGLLLTIRLYPQYIFPPDVAKTIPDYSSPVLLRQTVKKILDSEMFLTALRSTLPKGEDDKRYGLDFIPFILHSIDDRRKRALKSAHIFLAATIISALIFSSMVIYFGIALVNEASAGSAKNLYDLKNAMESTSSALNTYLPSYYNNLKFKQDVEPKLDNLMYLDPGPRNQDTKNKISMIIGEARRTGNFALMNSALSSAQPEISEESSEGKDYKEATTKALDSLSAFMNAQEVAVPELANRIKELKDLIPKAEGELNKPENRIPEIIKRLALGIVIATFFLALLRYMGRLYQIRYQQVMAAEHDDFMVRRFYIAFKGSTPSDEQRKTILSNFMTAPSASMSTDGKDSSGDTDKEYEILKELLAALSKKL